MLMWPGLVGWSGWSGWMDYIFEKSIPYKQGEVQAEEGAIIIPKWAVERWKRQSSKEYIDLPENEFKRKNRRTKKPRR